MATKEHSEQELKKLFDTFDVDKNGSITAKELQSVMKSIGDEVSCSLKYFKL